MLLDEATNLFKVHLYTIDRSPETITAYMKDLKYFNNYLKDKKLSTKLEKITTSTIEKYLYYMKKEKNLAPATRSRTCYTLRSFFKFAHRRNYCSKNPTLDVEPIKFHQKERIFLPEKQIMQFINAIEKPLIKVAAYTMYYTGLRVSECLNLKLKDVDLNNNLILVTSGKGNKQRKIPINKKLEKILNNYLKNIRPDVNSDNFFATKKTGKLSNQYVNVVLKKTSKKLGLNKNISAHILRHSFASNLLDKGANIVHIQKLLGHSSLRVTSIYVHTKMDKLVECVELL